MTQHIRPEGSVEFSKEACMQSSNGDVYSAFQRDSYIARVSLNDGRVICVSLPPGSRQRGKTELVTEAIQAATSLPPLPDGGAVFL